jgi:hypothetical protein
VVRPAVRVLALALALAAPAALAQSSIDGWGRVTVLGGYRWVPNWYFAGKAAEAQHPFTRPSPGAPSVIASFGYGATSFLEVAVDAFFSWESFELAGYSTFNAFTYGALLGPRLMKGDVLFRGFTPWVGVEAGPVFSIVNSNSVHGGERLLGTLAVAGGFHWRVNDRWAISFDVRWVYARDVVEGISGINVGGVTFSLGVTGLFPPAPKRELDVPGFTSPSNL